MTARAGSPSNMSSSRESLLSERCINVTVPPSPPSRRSSVTIPHGRRRHPPGSITVQPLDLLPPECFQQVADFEPHHSDQHSRRRVLLPSLLVVEGDLNLVGLVHLNVEVLHPAIRSRGVGDVLDVAVDLELDGGLVVVL